MTVVEHETDRRDGAAPGIAGKYVSLTTYRRDGSPVSTPMWFVTEQGRFVLETDADAYKVKRIRRNPHVRIAPCDARGRPRGEAIDAEARILPEDERERVEALLARKYRLEMHTLYPVYRLVMRLRGKTSRTDEPPVVLEITPT